MFISILIVPDEAASTIRREQARNGERKKLHDQTVSKVLCFEGIREIKIHVYSIRQTANVSGEFLRIENKQLKKVQNDSCGQNYHKTTYFCIEAINGKRKIGGKLGHVVQIQVCRLA